MFWISKLLGKNVVSLSDAVNLGGIVGFGFSKSESCLTVETSNGMKRLSGLFVLNDALVVSDYADVTNDCFNLIESQIFNTQGKYLSNVQDIFVDKDFNLKKILTADGTVIPQSKIFKIGETVLIRSALPKKIGKAGLKKTAEKIDKPAPAEKSDGVPRQYGDFSFLLGRICKKTITNFQGEVMVRREAVISKEILRQAKISGKLIELALNC